MPAPSHEFERARYSGVDAQLSSSRRVALETHKCICLCPWSLRLNQAFVYYHSSAFVATTGWSLFALVCFSTAVAYVRTSLALIVPTRRDSQVRPIAHASSCGCACRIMVRRVCYWATATTRRVRCMWYLQAFGPQVCLPARHRSVILR